MKKIIGQSYRKKSSWGKIIKNLAILVSVVSLLIYLKG